MPRNSWLFSFFLYCLFLILFCFTVVFKDNMSVGGKGVGEEMEEV